eukprot:Clim_evm1s211 gene=Clim_evmTU1s211
MDHAATTEELKSADVYRRSRLTPRDVVERIWISYGLCSTLFFSIALFMDFWMEAITTGFARYVDRYEDAEGGGDKAIAVLELLMASFSALTLMPLAVWAASMAFWNIFNAIVDAIAGFPLLFQIWNVRTKEQTNRATLFHSHHMTLWDYQAKITWTIVFFVAIVYVALGYYVRDERGGAIYYFLGRLVYESIKKAMGRSTLDEQSVQANVGLEVVQTGERLEVIKTAQPSTVYEEPRQTPADRTATSNREDRASSSSETSDPSKQEEMKETHTVTVDNGGESAPSSTDQALRQRKKAREAGHIEEEDDEEDHSTEDTETKTGTDTKDNNLPSVRHANSRRALKLGDREDPQMQTWNDFFFPGVPRSRRHALQHHSGWALVFVVIGLLLFAVGSSIGVLLGSWAIGLFIWLVGVVRQWRWRRKDRKWEETHALNEVEDVHGSNVKMNRALRFYFNYFWPVWRHSILIVTSLGLTGAVIVTTEVRLLWALLTLLAAIVVMPLIPLAIRQCLPERTRERADERLRRGLGHILDVIFTLAAFGLYFYVISPVYVMCMLILFLGILPYYGSLCLNWMVGNERAILMYGKYKYGRRAWVDKASADELRELFLQEQRQRKIHNLAPMLMSSSVGQGDGTDAVAVPMPVEGTPSVGEEVTTRNLDNRLTTEQTKPRPAKSASRTLNFPLLVWVLSLRNPSYHIRHKWRRIVANATILFLAFLTIIVASGISEEPNSTLGAPYYVITDEAPAAPPPARLEQPSNTANGETFVPYPMCGILINELNPLDITFLAMITYDSLETQAEQLTEYFGTGNATVNETIANDDTHPCTQKGITPGVSVFQITPVTAAANDPPVIVVSFRGTANGFDVLYDMKIWAPSVVAQVFMRLLPFGELWKPFMPNFLKYMTIEEGISPNLDEQQMVYTNDDVLSFARTAAICVARIRQDFPTSPILTTGHSLGGGLGLIAASANDVPAYTLSGPNTWLLHERLGVTWDSIQRWGMNVIPEHDLVPMVDIPGVKQQHIRCTGNSFLECHHGARTWCQLQYGCAGLLQNPRNVTAIPLSNSDNPDEEYCLEAWTGSDE